MTAQEILDRAAARDLLPTELSSAEIREALTSEIRRRSLFVARGTKVAFLSDLAQVLDGYIGGRINDADARLRLLRSLQSLGYTPELGFGDNMVPPADPGSITDLSSPTRLQFILDTQAQLLFAAGQKAAGEAPQRMYAYPAWELIRVARREVPRGQKMQRGVLVADPGEGWPDRWQRAGGELIDGRMIARKGATIWEELGSGALFSDALDTDHPPFAYNSGMGWKRVSRAECIRLGIITADWKPEGFDEWQASELARIAPVPATVPDINSDAAISARTIPADLLEAAKRELDAQLDGSTLRIRQSRAAARAAYEARRAERRAAL